MKNRLNIKFIAFIVILSGALIAPLCLKLAKRAPFASLSSTFDQTQAFFTNQLKNEENELWLDIKAQFGVDLARVSKDRNNQWLQVGETTGQKKDPMHKLIYEVAHEYNFDADKLEIVLDNSENGSPAMTNDMGQLIVEMNLLPILPEKVQRFIIAHELHHILNNDFAEIRSLKAKAKKLSMNPTQKALLQKYERFQEKRADMAAALKGKYWAEGYLAFANEGLKRCTNDPGTTHPTYKERKKFAQSILDHANQLQIA